MNCKLGQLLVRRRIISEPCIFAHLSRRERGRKDKRQRALEIQKQKRAFIYEALNKVNQVRVRVYTYIYLSNMHDLSRSRLMKRETERENSAKREMKTYFMTRKYNTP